MVNYENLEISGLIEKDAYQRPIYLEQIEDGIKTGLRVRIYYHNPNSPTREQGFYKNGNRIGYWFTYIGKGNVSPQGAGRWLKTSITSYSKAGKQLEKTIFHSNGKPKLEITYGDDEEPNHFQQYSNRGKLIFEGPQLPEELE